MKQIMEDLILNMSYFIIDKFLPFFTKLILVFHIVLLLSLLYIIYLALR
jgi:hypothetical protein